MSESPEIVLARLQETIDAYDAASKAACVTIAESILEDALPGVPVKTGRLRDSAYVESSTPATAGFDAFYARMVHEKEGANWKFLQQALQSAAQQTPSVMAELTARYMQARVTPETVARKIRQK